MLIFRWSPEARMSSTSISPWTSTEDARRPVSIIGLQKSYFYNYLFQLTLIPYLQFMPLSDISFQIKENVLRNFKNEQNLSKNANIFRRPRLLEEHEIPPDIIKKSEEFTEMEKARDEGLPSKEEISASGRRKRKEVRFFWKKQLEELQKNSIFCKYSINFCF